LTPSGFVGLGMLDAACPGEVFTSPVPDQMLAATKAVDGGAGVLHIVKNYTGDVLNFKLAAELAEDDGITVESVLTNDDVAVQDSLWTAGRRGVGVTVILEKIAGAKAEAGGSLAEVAAVARKVNDKGRSFGVALTSCATPAAGTPTFDIGPDEMEFGVGIHGEPGRRREKVRSAAEIVTRPPGGVNLTALPSRFSRARSSWPASPSTHTSAGTSQRSSSPPLSAAGCLVATTPATRSARRIGWASRWRGSDRREMYELYNSYISARDLYKLYNSYKNPRTHRARHD